MPALLLSRTVPADLAAAAHALEAGAPVLLFDAPDREAETDLIILAERATPELIRRLRTDAGGLLCTAISSELKERLGLPYFSELAERATDRYPILGPLGRHRLGYDRRTAFGVSVNHRSNFTGVPDRDRAQTIRAIGETARAAAHLTERALRERFADEFYVPGHIPLLYAAPGLVGERKGHTELAISLARMAGLSESVAVCEMLDDSGLARSRADARAYAEEHGWVFLDGGTVVSAWRSWSA